MSNFVFLPNIRKFKMAAIFRKTKIFWKLDRVSCLDTIGVENFNEIALSRTVKEIWAFLCFLSKIWKFQMVDVFWKYLIRMPCGPKILTKSLYLTPLRRYRHFCLFARKKSGLMFNNLEIASISLTEQDRAILSKFLTPRAS